MEFYIKLESFFSQLQFGLAIDPESVYQGEKRLHSLMLPHEVFNKYKETLQFDYPFKPVNKISELNALMKKEKIGFNEILEAIDELKKSYWGMPISLARETEDLLEKVLKSENKEITATEILAERQNYINYLEEIRESHLQKLIDKISTIETNNLSAKIELKEEINIFNKMRLDDVRKHFKVFYENSFGLEFLSNEDTEAFVQRAFLGNENIPKLSFKNIKGKRQLIIRRFQELTGKSINYVQDNQDKYINLLCDNFNGFEFEQVKANFAKIPGKKWN